MHDVVWFDRFDASIEPSMRGHMTAERLKFAERIHAGRANQLRYPSACLQKMLYFELKTMMSL
jgi:hypothetical protein